MIEYILLLLKFLFVWFTSFFIHELMHCYEAYRQGATKYVVVPEFKTLSMKMQYWGNINNKSMINLAGGVYTSPLMFIMALITYKYDLLFAYCFLTLGWIHLIYGIFEYKYLRILNHKDYKISRYIIYGIVILVMLILLTIHETI